ncbi:MAG: beta-ketoacyl synthase, partial [Candidatus Krumholzibacteria bacterium]|nr:beta-ketoacyl synthase [Candidatus Krumholzibacteria bacterium]
MCSTTGVDLEAGSRVIVCADRGGVGKALIGRLEKLGVETLVIDDTPTASALTGRIERWVSEKPVQGIYWLPALDVESPFTEMDLGAWREATHVRVKLLYTAARATYEQIGAKGTFLVSATRLGGKHGYDDTGAVAPLGGAVAGFTKAFKREKPEALVKVVDFGAGRKTATFADCLIEETRRDPGVVEVGYQDGHRWTIGLEERPLDSDTTTGVELDGDSVFVITGAAGSIVSAITGDLAAVSGGTFHLLDLAPAPDPNDADIQKFTADREGLKRDIFERLKSSGERATPKNVERELGAIERRHAALTAIQSVEAAGGTAHYYSVDLTDGEGVAAAMKDVAATSGRVDVLLHA